MEVDRPAPGEELNPGRPTEPRQAATVILLRGGRTTLEVLLVRRNPAARFMGGAWVFPGGAVDASEDHETAGVREVAEESGIAELLIAPMPVHLSEHAVPFCGPGGAVHHLDVRFVAVAPEDAEHAISAESLDVRWWPADALPDPEPELAELVRLAIEKVQSISSGGASTWAAADQPSR